jgi:hypothetical protein
MVLNNTTIPLQQYEESLPSTCFRIACYVLLTLSSVLGNSIVIKSIITIEHRKPLTYVLVANLAFAELIGSLALPAIQVYDEVYTWPFGDFLCHVFSPCQVVSCLVVTWTLAVISIYRFRTLFSIRCGLYYSNTRRSVLLASLWFLALAFCAPLFVFSSLVKSPFDDSSYWCMVFFPGDTVFDLPVFRKYILTRFVINFLIPILTMVTFYGAMAVKLKCHMTNQIHPITAAYPSMEMQRSTKVSTTEESFLTLSNQLNETASKPSTSSPSLQTRQIQTQGSVRSRPPTKKPTSQELEDTVVLDMDQDLLRMIYVVVAIFVVCFLPYQVFYLLEYFGEISYVNWRYFHITRRYIFLITCIPSALHPMCYGTMSRFYAKAFSYIFLCKFIKKILK